MEAHGSKAEILLADEQSPLVSEIQAAAKDLLFDSKERFESSTFDEDDWTEVFINYVLRGEDIGEPKSRHIGLAHDPRGLLVVMRSFSEENAALLSAESESSQQVAMISGEDADAPIVVNFFSYLLAPAGIRIEGMESDAPETELADLVATMRHPSLVEVTEELTVRYAVFPLAMLRDYGQFRSDAWEKFLDRKRLQLEGKVNRADELKNETRKADQEREILESERDEWQRKIDHPVRGVLSEMVEPFSRKLARRMLGL